MSGITQDEFMQQMLAAFPDAQCQPDNEGQMCIYTGLILDNGRIYPWDAPDFEWCVTDLDGSVVERFETWDEARQSMEQDYPEGTKEVHWVENPSATFEVIRVLTVVENDS
jgi:hypothetical protein